MGPGLTSISLPKVRLFVVLEEGRAIGGRRCQGVEDAQAATYRRRRRRRHRVMRETRQQRGDHLPTPLTCPLHSPGICRSNCLGPRSPPLLITWITNEGERAKESEVRIKKNSEEEETYPSSRPRARQCTCCTLCRAAPRSLHSRRGRSAHSTRSTCCWPPQSRTSGRCH